MNILLVVLVVSTILTLTYIYFWGVAIYARSKNHIDRSPVGNREIIEAARIAKANGDPYHFTIQITTRGGSDYVVRRGIRIALQGVAKYPVLKKILTIEVVTEDIEDMIAINNEFHDTEVPVKVFVMPADYATPKQTELKARALHYMVERHRENPRDSYIIHYDEESVLTENNLARLVRNLLKTPMGISEGTISYPLEWTDAHMMCRTMESSRPFGCHECYLMMTNPAPLHLHGSNLVVQERIENEIGWDIGRLGDKPLIAEDLVFGLMVYLKYGKSVFGWHGVEMIEQPPFTIKAAQKQRERWVMGALQGVAHVSSLPGYSKMSLYDRLRIQLIIKFRVATYAVGLPVSIVSLTILLFYVGYNIVSVALGDGIFTIVTFAAIPGLILWLGSNQLGLRQNLRYTGMNRKKRFMQHVYVLLLTPFSGIYDTSGPFIATIKWICGVRGIAWKPTPKLVGQEFGDNVKPLEVTATSVS